MPLKNQRFRHIAILMGAQLACLAAGMWIHHRLVVSLVGQAVKDSACSGLSSDTEMAFATLKKQGIEVSSPQVSMVLKRMGFRPQRRRKGGKAKAAAPRATAAKKVVRAKAPATISVDDLLAAKKVAEKFGSADKAIKVLEALKRFEG